MFGHLKRYALIYAGVIIYLLYLLSVLWTGWFDVFFSGAALHIGAKGIDFYQLPDGAWAFWHGGSLTGQPLPSGEQYFKSPVTNANVYHPLFTLTIGSLLSLFDPALSPYVWLCTKVYLSLALMIYFVWSFSRNKYIGFATFILLANFSIYLELAAWQFHSVLNMLLLLFLIAIIKKHSSVLIGLWYGLGMLIKPIGLLFLPLLILKGRWKAVGIGVGLFVLATLMFLYHGIGTYYTNNLQTNLSLSGTMGPNQIITFSAWLHYNTHWPTFVYQAIQYFSLLCIVVWGLFRKVTVPKAAFLMVAYYLCFYEQVFEYQWSTLAYVLAICVLTCPEFQTKRSLFCILLTCLPSCFILLNLWHIDVTNMGDLGMNPGATAWDWMVISKVVPLLLLLVSVLTVDIKPIFAQMKALWQAMSKMNVRPGVFGVDAPPSVFHPQLPINEPAEDGN